MAKRDAETRKQSHILYRELGRRETPDQEWWVNREVIEKDLGMNSGDLFDAAELLVEEGRVSYGTSDYITLRHSSRGPSIERRDPSE